MRSYAVGPGETVRCAVWADDDVLVTRLRGDFTGITSVDAEMRFDTGEEWGRVTDVPVRDCATELVFALPASLVRNAPSTLRYENARIVVDGNWVMLHGRFSRHGRPRAWVVADIVRMEGGLLAEHWDVLQDEATKSESQSGLPMFGTAFADAD